MDVDGLSIQARTVLWHIIHGDDPVELDEQLALELAFWANKWRDPVSGEVPITLWHEDDEDD